MMEKYNKKKYPEVEFTFREEGKSKEERKNEIEQLLKKRNELLAEMGIFNQNTNKTENNEKSNDYTRRSR